MDMVALTFAFKRCRCNFANTNMNQLVQFCEARFRALTHMGLNISALTAKRAQKITHILWQFCFEL
jgi:hypothetical protein